jgi:predicted amidohydrolase
MHIEFGNFETNLKTLQRLIEKAIQKHPDTIVLPELWDIGFYPRPVLPYADLNGKHIKEVLGHLAEHYEVNIVGGSIACRVGKQVFNTSYAFDRDGDLVSTYHKTHLFSPSGESDDFTAGDKIAVYRLDNLVCATILCYDIRFPELVRRLALKNVHILFVPAAWPIERLIHWQTLTRARAIENQFFVAAANGAGSFKNGMQLAGHSCIIDPWGEILAEAGEKETILDANLKPGIMSQIRSSIDVFDDRRPDLYHC